MVEKRIHIHYYAVLKETAGMKEETLTCRAESPAEVYDLLYEKYKFPIAKEDLKVSVNNQFTEWNSPLNDGDMIVFIPPVAGGGR